MAPNKGNVKMNKKIKKQVNSIKKIKHGLGEFPNVTKAEGEVL